MSTPAEHAATVRKGHADAMLALAADVHPYSPSAIRDNEQAMDEALDALVALAARADELERELDEGKLRGVVADAWLTGKIDALERDLQWEREQHDEARTQWLLMRDRLNGLREHIENALSQTEPPGGYEEPWCLYDGEVEAAPWAWLATLVSEALADFPPFDEESWREEEEKRKSERRALVERAEAAEAEAKQGEALVEAAREYDRATTALWDEWNGERDPIAGAMLSERFLAARDAARIALAPFPVPTQEQA